MDQEYRFIKTEYCVGGNLVDWLNYQLSNHIPVNVSYIFLQVMTLYIARYYNVLHSMPLHCSCRF